MSARSGTSAVFSDANKSRSGIGQPRGVSMARMLLGSGGISPALQWPKKACKIAKPR
jgi:hypothetical protein